MVGALVLAAAVALPTVIPDPRSGPSGWVVVRIDDAIAEVQAEGFLLELPTGVVDQEWLERLVTLGSSGSPVLTFGGMPPLEIRAYLDGAVLEIPPEAVVEGRAGIGGLAVVLPVDDAAGAIAALAGGAAAVLAPAAARLPESELDDLLPELVPARWSGGALPTALRGRDLATLIGLPFAFPGGRVALEGTWYGGASVVSGGVGDVEVTRQGGVTVIAVPSLPNGGVLVVLRPQGGGGSVDLVSVTESMLPTVDEVLARHQRAVARQQRLLTTWSATQRLEVRVLVGELGRSFEVILEGPVFHQEGVGRDWEIDRSWVDGVAWNPDELPDLPLLEPERPRVPPLALRLEPMWEYRLEGLRDLSGRSVFELSFAWDEGQEKRRGSALLDAETSQLVELRERATGLAGDVQSTTATTSYAAIPASWGPVSLPASVLADDLLAAFGGSAVVHRKLSLEGYALDPDDFEEARSRAYARSHRMLRDRPGGIIPLVADGHGGRVPDDGRRGGQRFILGGFLYDPGFDFPIPYGGLQIQDFDFGGRGEQLRLFLAGVVNDAAWSRPGGILEPSLRATTQLLAFSDRVWVRGEEVPGEEVRLQRQRVGAGLARSFGVVRWRLDLGVERLDFSRTSQTAPVFDVPPDTWEGTLVLQADASLGMTTVTAGVESGSRLKWLDNGERAWQRWRIAAVRETTPFPFGRLSFGAEFWGGRHLDRFSAPSPSRFGGLRLRGIASNRIRPERVAVVRGALALPVSPRVRAEVGVDLAWAREERSGYDAVPLAGVGVGLSLPGPFGTLASVSASVPLVTPGTRGVTVEVLLLRPLAARAVR